MKTRLYLLSGLVLAALMLCSCRQKGKYGETIILPTGTIPSNVVPSEIRPQFTNYITINEGSHPPMVEGSYIISPDVLVYSSDGDFEVGHQFGDKTFTLSEQNKYGVIRNYRSTQANDSYSAHNVEICGSGNDFTLYFIEEGYSDRDDDGYNETYVKQSSLVSGTISDEGILNLRHALVLLEKNDPFDVIMDVNEYRIFKDNDGCAYKTYHSYYAPANKAPLDNKSRGNELVEFWLKK